MLKLTMKQDVYADGHEEVVRKFKNSDEVGDVIKNNNDPELVKYALKQAGPEHINIMLKSKNPWIRSSYFKNKNLFKKEHKLLAITDPHPLVREDALLMHGDESDLEYAVQHETEPNVQSTIAQELRVRKRNKARALNA